MLTRGELLLNFRLAQIRLEQAKATEQRWRALVAQTFDNVRLGTNTSPDGLVKMVSRANIKLDDDKAKIQAVMSRFVAKFPNYAHIALIDWKYVLSEGEYNRLPEDAQIELADIITIKPGMPSVELVGS